MNEFTTDNEQQNYHEVQRSWWTWIIFAVVLIEAGIPLLVPMPQGASIAMIISAGVLTVITFLFRQTDCE